METSTQRPEIPAGAKEVKRRRRETVRVVIDGMTFVARYNNCNKSNCRKCPHGPYWSRIVRGGNREIEKYIGRDLVPWLARRWLMKIADEWNQMRLPGFPCSASLVPDEPPPWLPAAVYDALGRLDQGEPLTQERIDILMRDGI